jgi:hypothetical protein
MNICIPVTFGGIRTLLEIALNLHILAIIIVNLTKTPTSTKDGSFTSFFGSLYRLFEIFAGLITPLAKR